MAKESRAYLCPSACTLCKHSEKSIDRTCTACLQGTSKFERITPRQIALQGLQVDDKGRIYKELGAQCS